MQISLQKKAEELSHKVFVGGPVEDFEAVGRLQLITLLREGLYPHSKILDIGCGCLRAGYWLIHFLNKKCYYGIEPNSQMLNAGIEYILEKDLIEDKQPSFDNNADFNTSIFGEKFDFFLARSVWTHAAKPQIQKMLEAFVLDSTDNGVFLASYLPTGWFKNKDYLGNTWVGRSHDSDKPGLVYHSFKWIEGECQKRNLAVTDWSCLS